MISSKGSNKLVNRMTVKNFMEEYSINNIITDLQFHDEEPYITFAYKSIEFSVYRFENKYPYQVLKIGNISLLSIYSNERQVPFSKIIKSIFNSEKSFEHYKNMYEETKRFKTIIDTLLSFKSDKVFNITYMHDCLEFYTPSERVNIHTTRTYDNHNIHFDGMYTVTINSYEPTHAFNSFTELNYFLNKMLSI